MKGLIEKRQKKIQYLATGAVLVLFVWWLFVSDDPQPVKKETATKPSLPIDDYSTHEAWMNKESAENRLRDRKLETVEGLLLSLQKQLERKSEDEELKSREIGKQREEIQELKRQLQAAPAKGGVVGASASANNNPFSSRAPQAKGQVQSGPDQEATLLKEYQISKTNDGRKHVRDTIPHGTNAKALIISSVNAKTSDSSPSNPKPIQLRILEDPKLPKDLRVALAGTVVSASGFGDISTERVECRLEKLTKHFPDGSFITTDVAGYVTGEDGAYGIRGVVVDKSQELIKNAAYAGFLSGLTDTIEAIQKAQELAHVGPSGKVDVSSSILRESGLKGASSAMDKVVDHFIKRGERLDPVIQVGMGRTVTITFTTDIKIGEMNSKKEFEQKRKEQRRA